MEQPVKDVDTNAVENATPVSTNTNDETVAEEVTKPIVSLESENDEKKDCSKPAENEFENATPVSTNTSDKTVAVEVTKAVVSPESKNDKNEDSSKPAENELENATPISTNTSDETVAVEVTKAVVSPESKNDKNEDSSKPAENELENATPISTNTSDETVAVEVTKAVVSPESKNDKNEDSSKPAENELENATPVSTNTSDEKVTKPVVYSESENGKSEDSAKPAVNEPLTNGDTNGAENNHDATKTTVDNDDDFTDAMMENLRDNFNQDVDGMVSLMESAEDFMFESDDKQLNIKAAIEANKLKKEQESKSLVNSDKSEAYSLLAQGKRNLFVKDYESAVTTLGEACQKLNSIYGDFAVELADAYMTYGNALLELWRVEEADKKNNEDETAEIGEDVEEGNEDTENDITADDKDPSDGDNKPDESKATDEGDDEKEDENDKKDDDENEEKKEDDENEEKKEDDENEEKNEDAEEDIENEDDNIQIAWEVVELAKEIYIRHNDNVNVAKAYLKLGEISIASGNYALAVEDLTKSLELQKNITPADNRLKANTHFNLYVAYSASHEYDKSAEQLDTAKSVFETQVYDLSQKLKTMDKSNTSEIDRITKEISDTEEIMKDMDSKVLENNKHKRELMTALVEAIKKKTTEEGSESSSIKSDLKIGTSSNNLTSTSSSSNIFGGSSSSNVPVNNISHLIHKKPKQKSEPSVDKNHSQPEQNTATLNEESSLSSKVVTNSNSETSAIATNGTEKVNGKETNERKRKLSESGERSPKKACLDKE